MIGETSAYRCCPLCATIITVDVCSRPGPNRLGMEAGKFQSLEQTRPPLSKAEKQYLKILVDRMGTSGLLIDRYKWALRGSNKQN
jgi:hypothetical protein